MVHLFRVIVSVAGLLLGLPAFGQSCSVAPCYEYQMTYGARVSGWTTNVSACQWWLSANSADNPPGYAAVYSSAVGSTCSWTSQNTGQAFSISMPSRSAAPVATAAQTIAPLNAQADQRVWAVGGQAGLSFCTGGYVVRGTFSAATYDATQHVISGPFSSSGTSCNGSDLTAAPPTSASTTCAAGTYPGTVNGVSVCAPSTSVNTVSSGSSVKSSASSGGGTAPAISGAPAGATDSSVTTSCTGGNCSSTTSFNDAAGAPLGSVTSSTPKADYCALNPKSPTCGSGGSFGGSCSSSFTCDGDAVSCAAASAVNKAACSLKQIESTDGYGAPALAAAGVMKPTDSPFNNKATLDVQSLIVKTNPFSNSCPADYPLTLPHIPPIMIPLSNYCPALTFMGNVLLGLALLSGAIIIAKRD